MTANATATAAKNPKPIATDSARDDASSLRVVDVSKHFVAGSSKTF